MGGYLTVAIAYLLTQAGVSVEEVAELVAFSYIPHTWKFLWAPLADTTLSRKTWYLVAGLVSALGTLVTGVIPAEHRFLPLLYAAVLVSNVAVTFLAMASESLMAYNTRPEEQGRAGGWFQAGNLGGLGLGGGAGLWLAQNLAEPWMAGAALAVACALCAAALLFVPNRRASRAAAAMVARCSGCCRTSGAWHGRAPASWLCSSAFFRSAPVRRPISGPQWRTIGTRAPIRWHS